MLGFVPFELVHTVVEAPQGKIKLFSMVPKRAILLEKCEVLKGACTEFRAMESQDILGWKDL